MRSFIIRSRSEGDLGLSFVYCLLSPLSGGDGAKTQSRKRRRTFYHVICRGNRGSRYSEVTRIGRYQMARKSRVEFAGIFAARWGNKGAASSLKFRPTLRLIDLKPMQKRDKLRSYCLFLLLLLTFSQTARAATLFPNRSRGWNKIPTVVVLGREGDSRNQLVNDAVDFWNQQLAEIGSGFRLGPVTFVSEIIATEELEALSKDVLVDRGH